MKKILLETTKIVGTATKDSWSQVHTFSPAEAEKQTRRGRLLAVLSLKGLAEGLEAVAAGREVISRLHEEYYGNLEGSAFNRLKTAVEKVAAEAGETAEIEIGAAAILGQTLYLAITGKGQVLLQRQGQTGMILQGNDQVAAASGRLQSEDLFLLGTGGFFQAVSSGVIRAALSGGSPAEATEILAPAVHGRSKSGTVAAVIGQVKQEPKRETKTNLEPESGEKLKPKGKLKERLLALLIALQNQLGEKTIYLKRELRTRAAQPKQARKTAFMVALVLVFLLVISVVLGSQQRKRLGLLSKTTGLLAEAQEKKEEGEALLELNPSRARELLFEAQALVKEMEAEGVENEELEMFKKELDELLDQVWQEHQVEAETFFDLELIKQEAKGDNLAVSGGKMMILDKEKRSVYELGMADKKSAIVAGGKELEGADQIAAFLPRIFVLTGEGIFAIDKVSRKEELVIEEDDNWGEVIDFWAFAGNLYLLNREGIWQYLGTETDFGSQRQWLTDEVPDFSEVVSMAIDGSIWTLEANGRVLKFTQRKRDAFGVAGLDQPWVKPSLIYTDDDSENLYILDKGNRRVVVIAKSGEFEATYNWEGIERVSDLAVSEEEGKIFLLEGSKIYKIDLK